MSLSNSYQYKGQLTLAELFPDSWYGKTYPEHSVPTTERTSEPCLKKQRESKIKTPLFLDLRENKNGVRQAASWVTGGALLGEYTMLSFGECPKEEKESHLSQILQGGQLQKYYLSAKACQGILNRAKRRGKKLPEMLRIALEQQSVSLNEPDAPGGGKGILIQDDQTGTLSTVNNQSVCYPINTMIATRGKALGRGTGFGVGDDGDAQFTLSTVHEHAVCYGICSDKSNSMLSGNPHSGIYEADTSRTLDNNGGNPACNQGGMMIVEKAYCIGNGQLHDAMTPSYEVSKTLNCLEDPMKVVTYGIDRASFNQGQNAKYNFSVENDLAQTIVAKDPGGVLTEQ